MEQHHVAIEPLEVTGPEAELAKLNRTEYRILVEMLGRIPAGQTSAVVENKVIAEAVKTSVRTVQAVFQRFVERGILQRVPVNPADPFSKRQTIIGMAGMMAKVRHDLTVSPGGGSQAGERKRNVRRGYAKRKERARVDVTMNTDRFPFRSLRDPVRHSDVPRCMDLCLATGEDYWIWLFETLGAERNDLTLRFESQKRKVRDGERGGLIEIMRRAIPLSRDISTKVAGYARGCHRDSLEGTFGVVAADHPLLLVDDVNRERLKLLPAAAAVLETSPGSFQATLIAPRNLTKQERLFAQRALIEAVSGDLGANNASQLRRFPGSINNKPELSHAFVTKVYQIPDCLTLTEPEINHLIAKGAAAYRPPRLAIHPLITGAKVDFPENHQDHLSGARDTSPSGRDFSFAVSQIIAGVPDQKIIDGLIDSAGRRKKGGAAPGSREHRAYAERTLRNAHERCKVMP